MANIGKSILRDKKPSGPKSRFASKISPMNHADKAAATAVRNTARFPFRLNIKDIINPRNTKNSKIVKTNPFTSSASKIPIRHLDYITVNVPGQSAAGEAPFKERVAGMQLRQFLQKRIDITGTMRYNQFVKSELKEKEYEKFFYARASFSDIRNR